MNNFFKEDTLIYCPYCNYYHSPTVFIEPFSNEPVEGLKECIKCGKSFFVIPDTKVVYIYKTRKLL